MIQKVTYQNLNQIILFGGGATLVSIAEYFIRERYQVLVFTAPRHSEEFIADRNRDFTASIELLGIPLVITDNINECPEIIEAINPNTLGIGFGEAWSFSTEIIEAFDRVRLLDFMGIPLPRYRGGAHYTWMIQRGDRKGGFHLQLINEDMVQGEFDSAELIYSEPFVFPKEAKIPEDYFQSAKLGEVSFLIRFHEKIKNGTTFNCTLPNESDSLFFPRLNTDIHGWIDWQWQSKAVIQFIDSFDRPYGGAKTIWNGQVISLSGVTLDLNEGDFHPFQTGLVTRIIRSENESATSLSVITQDGLLTISNIRNDCGDSLMSDITVGDRFYTPEDRLLFSKKTRISYDARSKTPCKKVNNKPLAKKSHSLQNLELSGSNVTLRPITLEDCTQTYLTWLQDSEINQYLETRWREQTLVGIQEFVVSMNESEDEFLYAIVDSSNHHLGNIKLGPINWHHRHAEISYFIGEKAYWGKGVATQAIQLLSNYALKEVGLSYMLAGVYESNFGSIKALKKSGYTQQGRLVKQLIGPNGREDHLFFGLSNESSLTHSTIAAQQSITTSRDN